MTALVCLGALLLAFVNGANDNMKGVATLYGSGALSYRRALGPWQPVLPSTWGSWAPPSSSPCC